MKKTARQVPSAGPAAGTEVSWVERAPALTAQDAERIVREQFNVGGTATALPSERDQNFQVTTEHGEQLVLKIANAGESREILDLQNRAMQHLAGKLGHCRVPTVRPNRSGELISAIEGPSDVGHLVRLLDYLPGTVLAEVIPHAPELLADLGATLGRVDIAFRDFSHPVMHREFHWDLQRAGAARQLLSHIQDQSGRELVEHLLTRFEQETSPQLNELPAQIIHNDANDYNVIVTGSELGEPRVAGLLDYGDMVHAPAICDLAVGATYVLLGKPNPLEAAAHVVRGYHGVSPLQEREIDLLFELIQTRLCLSVIFSAYQHRRAPANEYLRISEQQAWEALGKLNAVSPRWARAVFRHACGLPPFPESTRIAAWLEKNRAEIGPVVEPGLNAGSVRDFDLSAASPELPGGLDPTDPDRFSRFIFDEMRASNAKVGIGRYDEARLCYRAAQFEIPGNDGPQRRTVHLGLDLFLPAGSPVFAPLDGRVHSFQDNSLPLDYGPTVILEHNTGGAPFFTLYGHLSRASLSSLRVGQKVQRGERIGKLGEPAENGGWPSHLHLQLIADMLDRRGDFPGVAAPAQCHLWLSLCPDPNLLLGMPPECFPPPGKQREEIMDVRRVNLGPSLSLSYRKPLHLVRGFMQYLYDAEGRTYLDAVNNVPHVGHCHPRVVRAGQRQMALLNTNTRYLYGPLAEYLERLVSLLPEPLKVCFLVCSGSEANELALRLARAYTRRRDIVVVEGGYHGNTTSLIEVSPYKFDGPGGEGATAHVNVVPLPDTYGGPHRADDPQAAARYAAYVSDAIARAESSGRNIGAFLMESLPSSAGMIIPPEGYLSKAYRQVRAAGGVCIADEVQVGFGRTGRHFWGFQLHGVAPDIVTLGKPIGNGHPLAAVVTTREIAQSFAGGMEYFNTFGGNPVSCAIGLAVLDVLRDERLQDNARVVGDHLLDGLRQLQKKHPVIGHVRGTGFFIGVELVRDPATREPASAQAAYIAERMKDRGVLIGTEGSRHNVLKIRPPMVLTTVDADRLLVTLDSVLAEDAARVLPR